MSAGLGFQKDRRVADLFKVDWSTLPEPKDDGAAAHLAGMRVPSLSLPSTAGGQVDVSGLAGKTVMYIYPMTGRPNEPLPDGWDLIPGARGCTPQSCAFRDHHQELVELGVNHLFGLSTQTPVEQQEAADRLHLPFALLSDERHRFGDALKLPRFNIAERVFLRRLTMVIDDGVIEHVIYPVFPPDQNAEILIGWLSGSV